MMNRLRRIPAGSIFGILVAIYIGFYLVTTVEHNYRLQQQISAEQQQITNLQTSNQTLKYQIEYYNTDDYKQEEARAKLGLQAPGEKVILLPQSSSSTTTTPTPTTTQSKSTPKLSHWQQWVSFLEGDGA